MAKKSGKPEVTNYNDEIVQVFEELKIKYEEIEKEITFTEQRKELLTQNVAMMTSRMGVDGLQSLSPVSQIVICGKGSPDLGLVFNEQCMGQGANIAFDFQITF